MCKSEGGFHNGKVVEIIEGEESKYKVVIKSEEIFELHDEYGHDKDFRKKWRERRD